jgi:hypothetical protein
MVMGARPRQLGYGPGGGGGGGGRCGAVVVDPVSCL